MAQGKKNYKNTEIEFRKASKLTGFCVFFICAKSVHTHPHLSIHIRVQSENFCPITYYCFPPSASEHNFSNLIDRSDKLVHYRISWLLVISLVTRV